MDKTFDGSRQPRFFKPLGDGGNLHEALPDASWWSPIPFKPEGFLEYPPLTTIDHDKLADDLSTETSIADLDSPLSKFYINSMMRGQSYSRPRIAFSSKLAESSSDSIMSKTYDPSVAEWSDISFVPWGGFFNAMEPQKDKDPKHKDDSRPSNEFVEHGLSGKTLESNRGSISGIFSHMLPEKAGAISEHTWKQVAQLLPDSLRLSLQFNNLQHGFCWTFTPNAAFEVASIPLTIAGIPVVVPLKYRYPIHAPSGVPPDPFPHRIDPSVMVDDSVIDQVFNTFSHVLGFYVLINGFIQLLIPEEFNLANALHTFPSRFGGLKVSYVPFSVLSTGSSGESPAANASSSTTGVEITSEAVRGSELADSIAPRGGSMADFRMSFGKPSIKSLTSSRLDFLSTLRVRVLKKRSPSWFGGKPGVLTRKGSQRFLTFSTHIATKALEEAKHKFQPNDDWTNKVEVYHGNAKVC